MDYHRKPGRGLVTPLGFLIRKRSSGVTQFGLYILKVCLPPSEKNSADAHVNNMYNRILPKQIN